MEGFLLGKKIFITGGTGFIGRWLLETFVEMNRNIGESSKAVVLSRNPEKFLKKAPHLSNRKDIEFVQGDVRSFEFPREKFNYIIHAATDVSTDLNQVDPLEMLDVIVEGTKHVLDFAVKCNAEKFLFISSGAVYGRQPPEITHIPEDFSGAPLFTHTMAPYGEGKRTAELLCYLYSKKYGFEVKIARCFALVGPYMPLNAHYAIGNFIRDGLSGGPIVVKGDGTPYRSYLYASDLVVWLWTILFRGENCKPYNVGSEEAITIRDLAYLVASCFDKPMEVKILGTPDPNKPPERYVPSTARARRELGLKQNVSLKDAILKTIEYYRNANLQY